MFAQLYALHTSEEHVMDVVLVTSNGVDFYVEVETTPGPSPIEGLSSHSFEHVRETVEQISMELSKAWEKVRPTEASVEFGLKVTAKSGKLTGLLVEGGAEAALNVKLTW